MTSNKPCDHILRWESDVQPAIRADIGHHVEDSRPVLLVRCFQCGQRFVPSDVLEQAAKEVRAILDAYGIFDGNSHMRMSGEISAALARIDAVLGKKP